MACNHHPIKRRIAQVQMEGMEEPANKREKALVLGGNQGQKPLNVGIPYLTAC